MNAIGRQRIHVLATRLCDHPERSKASSDWKVQGVLHRHKALYDRHQSRTER